MTMQAGYWVDLATIKFGDEVSDDASTWIQALPIGVYQHPLHGKISITPERVKEFADNVNNGVRSTALDIDYDHKEYGGEAAGWVKQAEARPDGLWILIEWTKKAYGMLKEHAYRYFSPEFADEWTHPKTGQTFKNVLFGGGITNRPFLKDILPINMSELFDHQFVEGGKNMTPEQLKELAKLLGLPEDASGDQILGALQVTLKIPGNKDPEDPASPDKKDPAGADAPKDPFTKASEDAVEEGTKEDEDDPQKYSEISPELLKLAETKPAIKALTDRVMAQEKQLAANSAALKLTEVEGQITKLSEKANKAGFAIPPVTKDAVRAALLITTSKKFSDTVMQAFDTLMDAKLVALGEKGHSRTEQGENSAIKKFSDAVETLRGNNKELSYADAVTQVAAQQPQLFEEYRVESFAGRE